jgi:ribose-phosphate pyrophosphokinase
VSPSGKAAVFGIAIRRFDPFHPNKDFATDMTNKRAMLFTGRSHPELAKEIAECFGVKIGSMEVQLFPDGEIGVQIKENVRGRDIFLVQSIVREPNLYLMELLIMIDAFKRASVRSLVVVIPYYGYARQDRKDKGRVPITAKLVANLLEKAGATRVLTMDLHTDQIQGFFDIPLDNLYARPVLLDAVKKKGFENGVVVAPDVGGIRMARQFAEELKTDLAIVDKRRISSEIVEANALIGDVKNRDVLLVDDMCSTGGTIAQAAAVCRAAGAKKVFAAATHGLFLGGNVGFAEIDVFFTTNTVPPLEGERGIERVSVAKLFAEAMQSIVDAKSISSLFC